MLKKTESILHIFFVLLFFVLSSCRSSSESQSIILSYEEHRALESLFSHFLLQEGGAYTLFGSKPMSFEVLSHISEKEKQEFLSFSSHHIIKNELDFFENWNVWKCLKDQFPMSRFLLVERKPPAFSIAESSVFLVNIAATAYTLQQHYQKFRAAVSDDFDPLDIVFEVQDNNSHFWNTILAREDLLGILLGYGEENAWLFVRAKAWEEQKSSTEHDSKSRFLASLSIQSPGSNALSSFDASFPLPCFGCYAEKESLSLIKKYESERNEIKRIYQGKDFVQITLDRLTSKDLSKAVNDLYIEKLAQELEIQDQLEEKQLNLSQ